MNTKNTMKKILRLVAAGLALVLVQGCATGPNANPADPFEPFNRGMFGFNEGVDRAILKPVATVYRDVLPSPVRTGVTNFFGNISDVWSLVNNILQGKPKESAETLMRVSVNTIFGFAGVLDIATEMRLEKRSEDFGQTLGYWGMGSGPYLVLPVLGPSNFRDGIGTAVDFNTDLVNRTDRVPVRNSLAALRVVNTRANFLNAGEVLDQAALDKYSFTRDLYLQRRESLIRDNGPEKEERYDLPETSPAGTAAGNVPPAAK
jgi:phospholipid-binding lipoprotein MlaA